MLHKLIITKLNPDWCFIQPDFQDISLIFSTNKSRDAPTWSHTCVAAWTALTDWGSVTDKDPAKEQQL